MINHAVSVAHAILLTVALLAMPGPSAARVPLVKDLVVTTAIAEAGGDYESRKHLIAREDEGWRMVYSSAQPGKGGSVEPLQSVRVIHDADLQAAPTYRNRFESGVEEDYPGTTALGTSSEVLKQLQTAGKSRFAVVGEDQWLAQALAGVPGAKDTGLGLAAALTAGKGVKFKGELQRKSIGTLTVLVNGKPETLPVLTANGRLAAKNGHSMDAELSFLNDAANPIALQWRIGTSTLRVVRLDFPQARDSLVTELQEKKRVTLSGLYFDFGSAVLKPESAANLPAIVAAIRAAPPGVLRLEGHTDNVGKAAANQSLSQARAEAVRHALIKIDASLAARLASEGFGATRPQASNATLEGRAQNRRVELMIP